MMNSVNLVGRLTKDANVAHTAQGVAIAHFTLACDRDYTNKNGQSPADFINCELFGYQNRKTNQIYNNQVKNLLAYTHKGSLVSVSGRLTTSSSDVGGKRSYFWAVRVQNWSSLDFSRNASSSNQGRMQQKPADPLANAGSSNAPVASGSMPKNPFASANDKTVTDPFANNKSDNKSKQLTGASASKKISNNKNNNKKIDISDDDLPF